MDRKEEEISKMKLIQLKKKSPILPKHVFSPFYIYPMGACNQTNKIAACRRLVFFVNRKKGEKFFIFLPQFFLHILNGQLFAHVVQYYQLHCCLEYNQTIFV